MGATTTRRIYRDRVPCGRKPEDFDQTNEDATGQLEVQAESWAKGHALSVWITARGGYADWSDEDLVAEASYMLGNH
jgi:hypothetical protein